MVHVEFLDLNERIATISDGTIGQITNMYDDEGDETDDPDEVVSLVVKHNDQSWFSLELADFSPCVQQ